MAYMFGCFFGWFLRNVFGTHPQVADIAAPSIAATPVLERPTPMPPPKPVAMTPPQPVAVARPQPTPRPAPIPIASPVGVALAEPVGKMARPKGLSAARGGKADDLKRISGIGPKNEGILHNLGFFHFDQIAAWTAKEVSWVDDHLRFNGRIMREEWVRQARLLSLGKEDEFTREFGTGGLKAKDGQTLSGSQTRKR